jgi:transcription initiation factor TFIID subunit 1
MSDSDEDNYNKDEDCVDLTGFLFGNINEQGELESDVLDTESQKQLSNLGKLGLGSTLKEMIGVENITKEDSDSDYDMQDVEKTKFEENSSEANSQNDDMEAKSPSAIDFSDINELAEEEEETKQENYDADDEHPKESDVKLMPPPPVPIIKETIEQPLSAEDGDKKKLETPLAAMLPSKYANIDVTDLFPDFRC